jgi:folate-binding protein YgfZ
VELIEYSRERFESLSRGALAVRTRCAAFEIAGPGALACLQGLLTNDLVGRGPGSLVYGALLTAKGMIVVDYWVFRLTDRFVLVADRVGHGPSLELFRRQMPPRLAKVTDRSEEWSALWLLGEEIEGMVAELSGGPEPGTVSAELDGSRVVIGRGGPRAPFRHLMVGDERSIAAATERLVGRGVVTGTEADLRAARVRAGWPTLGPEIDQRTMPGEVSYEELDGVSYTKGCYVGQETVARMHFRGHPNWHLRGIRFEAGTVLAPDLEADGKRVARLGTVIRFEDGSGLGLGLVRREVPIGSALESTSGTVTVTALPFGAGG